ncbi:uncharacterized protein UHOD_11846 [Ustilago sp. UG-2017b]|nr:uncharacterized protein UHOD_11846 [Ustilago sp. UG-2017b]
MRGGPSAAKEGTKLRNMQLVTTQGPQDEDLEDRCWSKEEELCQGHRQAGHECHGPECTGSMKAVGSYGRSTGTKGRVTEEDDRSRSRGGQAEARGLAGTSCRRGQSTASMETMETEDQTRMQGGPSTTTMRTELKEHADGYHSGAREIRVKGTVTGRRRRSSV